MKKLSFVFSIVVSALMVAAVPATNFAQTSSASSTPATGISNDFDYFLGNVDSQQVVSDLRNGQWSTTVTDPATNTTTTTTEALPTGKMGWGNVKISLALAQESLRQQGIYQPTSEELHTALVGGEMMQGDTTVMTKGVLQMRSEGMGWGEIAKQYNVKLGQLMSGIKSGKQPVTTTTTTTGADTTTTSATSKGIVTGRGKSSDAGVTTTGKGYGKSIAGSKSRGQGIVSASGQAAGSSSFASHGSRGIVTGSGRAVGHTSGIVTGSGNGHAYGASAGSRGNAGGQGKGHTK